MTVNRDQPQDVTRPMGPTRGDRGEGVISTAIAVLVMAFLGALMWVGFQQMWSTTQQQTTDQLEQIGG
jgi:hypothetical protein